MQAPSRVPPLASARLLFHATSVLAVFALTKERDETSMRVIPVARRDAGSSEAAGGRGGPDGQSVITDLLACRSPSVHGRQLAGTSVEMVDKFYGSSSTRHALGNSRFRTDADPDHRQVGNGRIEAGP